MNIGTRLKLGFGVNLFFILFIGGLGVYEIHQTVATSQKLLRVDTQLVELAERMRGNINMMRRYEKDAFFNVGTPAKVSENYEKWKVASDNFHKRMDEITTLETMPEDIKTLTGISKNVEDYEGTLKAVLTRITSGTIANLAEANRAMGNIEETISTSETAINNYAKKNRADGLKAQEDMVQKSVGIEILLGTILGLSFVSISILVIKLTRSILNPLSTIQAMVSDLAQGEGDLSRRLDYAEKDELGAICGGFNLFLEKLRDVISRVAGNATQLASATHELSATAEQINTTTRDISSSAEHQRLAMAQSSAALEQVSASISQVRGSAGEAENVAAGSLQVSAQGRGAADESTQAMSAIEESSTKVNQITSVIADIARQTNLLSLNAAIEAAKAGAQGKGFAVVAEEIRKLAERSASAAKEIASLIQESGDRVAVGINAVSSVGRSLVSIEQGIRDNSDRIRGISLAMEEQAKASQELLGAVSSTSRTTEQNASATTQLAATVQEVTRTIEDLARMAGELQGLTGRFKLA